MGEDPRPIDYLHSFALEQETAGGDWPEVMKVTERAASANNIYQSPLGSADGVAMVTKYLALVVVFLVSRGRLGTLDAYGDAVPREARIAIAREANSTKGAFAFVFKRSTLARGFVIVSSDAAGAKTVADALFAQDKTLPGVFRPNR